MYKVLLIDDEPWILKDIELLVDWEGLGFKVIGKISDSEQAMYFIKKQQPELIICDIKMPGLNGLDLMRMVKKRFGNIFVVFLSAYSEFSYAKEAIEIGAFDYILKPTEKNELIKVVAKARKILDKDKEEKYFNKEDIEDSGLPEVSNDIIEKIIEEIEDKYNQDLRLQDLADKYHVNYNYLGQLFKKEIGKTFTNYLVELRIKKAIELFSKDFLFYEVAKIVGYNDYYHFCKIFKKHKGMNPSEYKKIHIDS